MAKGSQLKFVLTHDGTKWRAWNEDLSASACSLEELDKEIKEKLLKLAGLSRGTPVLIHMEFDYSTIPSWIRQYHPYYIYRTVEFTL